MLASKPGANVRELCRRAGISPTTGYKWLARYRLEGAAGLADRSRASSRRARNRTPAAVEAKVVAIREEHPAWGGRKIQQRSGDGPSAALASTITAILRRHDRLDGPEPAKRAAWTRFERAEPNELWQMDFKGHFPLAKGRCHPLTVLDDHSRYALGIEACDNEQDLTVRDRLTRLFRRYGLPFAMLMDNGSPWGDSGSQPFTIFTTWLMRLGIRVSHGRPYHPQTQGKDERFHRSLKAEVLAGRTFESMDQAQAALDAWRQVYNTKRPHEGIGLVTPDTRYRMSARSLPERIEPPEYEPQAIVRKVQAEGKIHFLRPGLQLVDCVEKGRRLGWPCP